MNQYSHNMSNKWIQPQDQAFEHALAPFPESIEPQWENVPTNFINQSPVDVWDPYQPWIHDCSDFASQDTLSHTPQLGASNPPLINWRPTAVSGIENQWESVVTDDIGDLPGNFYQSLLVPHCGDFASRGTLPQKLQSGASNPSRVTCLPVATVPYTHDVSLIDSGHVELLNYKDNKYLVQEVKDNNLVQEPIPKEGHSQQRVPCPRKKALPWTEEEHRLFLRGLQKYGRGDWKSISRFVVVSKTPSQVASHAQKYFLRQSAAKKERKRSSIHDITLNDSDLVPHPIIEQQHHNEIPTSIGPMHQFPEMPQVQQMNVPMNQFQEMQPTQQMHQLNPPNNMLHQMSGSVDFDNDARIIQAFKEGE